MQERHPAGGVISILCILALALALRAYGIGHTETTGERMTLYAVANASQPTTYSVLAGFASGWFGWPSGGRLLSLLASLGTVLLIYRLAAGFFNRRAAAIAGTGAAVSPYLVHHAQLATSTSLTLFLAVVVVACHLRAVVTRSVRFRIAYLAALFLLAASDFNAVLPAWGPAVLLLAGLAVADGLTHKKHPITRRRVAVAYLLPLVILSPFFAYTLVNELSVVWEGFAGEDTPGRETYSYSPRFMDSANVFFHYLLGHGKLKVGEGFWLTNKFKVMLTLIVFASLAAGLPGIAYRLRRAGPKSAALRMRAEPADWTGFQVSAALIVVPVMLGYLLQWFFAPRGAEFHLLLAASGAAFLILISAGLARLLENRWSLALLVAPLALIVLFSLRKTYQILS